MLNFWLKFKRYLLKQTCQDFHAWSRIDPRFFGKNQIISHICEKLFISICLLVSTKNDGHFKVSIFAKLNYFEKRVLLLMKYNL